MPAIEQRFDGMTGETRFSGWVVGLWTQGERIFWCFWTTLCSIPTKRLSALECCIGSILLLTLLRLPAKGFVDPVLELAGMACGQVCGNATACLIGDRFKWPTRKVLFGVTSGLGCRTAASDAHDVDRASSRS